VLTRVRAALGLSEDQQFAPPGPHMQPQSPPQARGPLATAGWAAATAASGSAAGGALSPAFSATAPVSQQQQQQQQQRRAAAAAAAAGAPALVFSPADPSNSSHNNSSSRGGSIAVATVAASSASADPSAAAAGAAGAVLVDSLAQRLRSGTYRSVLDENARLAEAVRQADAVSGELIANAAALTELAAQHDAEAQRLMAALDASGAEREHVEVEVRGLRRLMGRMRAERAQALHHLTTACGKLGVATDRVLTLESRNERVEFELAEIKRALRDEAERAAQHRDEASALRAERKKRHAELEQLQKDRAELTQLRLRSDALRLEWERKERAWTEERDALMAQLAARRQRQLASDAELRQVREEKGTLATDLARAAQLASELDLKVDSLRRDLRSEREGVSDRDKAIARLEKLLAEVRAQLKEEEESRARTAESAKDGGARLSAVEAELALLKQQLRTETEERRAAQQAHRQLKRDHEKAVKSSSKQGEEYLALLRQYEALKDRHINVNKELSAANAKVRSLEAQADASAELQLAFTQAQSDVQRLTLRLHDLKTSTDAQIMSLTDARDRLGHQSELLRSKVGAVSNAMEEQKAELKRLRRVEQDLEGIMQAVTVERDSAKREAEAVRSQLSEASDHNQGLVEALESTVAELRAELRRARHGSLRPPGSGQSPSGGDDEGGGGGGERRGSTSGGGGDGGSPSAAGGDSRGSVRLSRGTLVSRRFAAAQAAAAAGGTDPGEAAAAAAAAARRASAELRVSQSRADSAAAAAMLQDLLSQSQSEVQTLRSMLTTLEDEKTIRVQEMQDSRAQAADTQQRLTGSVIALQRKVAELEHELSKEREGRLGNDIY
jgi:chromosome segregation ATPase